MCADPSHANSNWGEFALIKNAHVKPLEFDGFGIIEI